ncbi:hypothetical protein FRB94_008037 [Tulasnella sp. JGI-2019a]|nr:hypothetical protein FRB93_006398 [Tulasnella sp. JGI-2019a]KAG8996783.1 hypothetical protein FRB94_008037 [Tulasnella sp. JGI-2019a]KAG9025479.1 hypothetical protein FRB95_010113 [Tulasnella sp. JGI-2019a]
MAFSLKVLSTLVLTLAATTPATCIPGYPKSRRQQSSSVPDLGFYDPHLVDGGYMLTNSYNEDPNQFGEPLNIIISAHSDPAVLVDQGSYGGLRNYFQSLGFSSECLGASSGTQQTANLGDGRGYVTQMAVIRWDYGNPTIGTCEETLNGGNHFRYWRQNGSEADSGAYFLAASYESPLAQGHTIVMDGYNLGRDQVVGNATQYTFPYPNPLNYAQPTSTVSILGNATTASTSTSAIASAPTLNSNGATGVITFVPNGQFSGTTSANGYTYKTSVTYVSGLLANSSIGVNHGDTVTTPGGLPAQDGLVAVFMVTFGNASTTTTTNASKNAAVSPSFSVYSGLVVLVITTGLLILA